MTGTFAVDAAIFVTHKNPIVVFYNLPQQINNLETWLIKVNETNPSHITITLRIQNCQPVNNNHFNIPQREVVKYLGLQFDKKSNWMQHITKKRNTNVPLIN